MAMKRVYLDYSATTPVDPRVIESMNAAFAAYGNASSVHSFGREARAILEESRDRLAKSLGARSDEVFFTSGGTESDNHAIKGVMQVAARKGKREIITSPAEHHAVLRPAETLHEAGFDMKFVPVDSSGRVDPDDVKKLIGPNTALVSLMLVNNEVGTINDIRTIGGLLRAEGIPFHSDIVQAVGKMEVNLDDLNVDLASVSAHKFYGPKGIGAIYIRKGTAIDSYVEGGSQESNRRAGTENVPLAVGLATAAGIAKEMLATELPRVSRLSEMLKAALRQGLDGIRFNGNPTSSVPHIVSVSFDSKVAALDGDALIMGLDLMGVAVTSGSACTSGSLQPSHVLTALGSDVKTARSTVRFSVGRYTTEDELKYAVECLGTVVTRMRGSKDAVQNE